MSSFETRAPKPLYRRFEFESYSRTREFLDRLAELSESCGFYPNIDFATNYVRIGIDGDDQAYLLEHGSNFISDMEGLAEELAVVVEKP